MSASRRMPPRIDHSEDITQRNNEHLRELLNDQLLSQQFLATNTQDATQTYASATYIGNYSNYATYSFTPSTSIYIPTSQGNTRDFQRISDEFAALASTTRNSLHATWTRTRANHPHYTYSTREESVIPEGAVFPIDIPINRGTTPTNVALLSDSEPGGRRRDNNLISQRSRGADTYVEPLGGQTLVSATVSYDDHDIPQYDSSWLTYPYEHPWIRSREAYICGYNSCNTIVQQKNRYTHNMRAHGIF